MGKPVSSDMKRVEVMPLSTKVNKEVSNKFKDCCKELGYPINVMLETFMRQYADRKFDLKSEDILKWKDDDSELDALSTTLNKEIYFSFKSMCKVNGYFVKHVITAFMEKFTEENLILEYVNISKKVKVKKKIKRE